MAALNFSHRLFVLLIVTGWCLTMASCGFVEKQIDKTVGGANGPADTTVVMAPDAEETKAPEIPPSPAPTSGPLKITTTDAVLLSLTNNRSLVVEKLNPAITKTFEDTERAVFDPNLAGGNRRGSYRRGTPGKGRVRHRGLRGG